MRIGITGTPGTGKTTATAELGLDRPVLHLNEVITEQGLTTGWDDERDSAIADLDALRGWLAVQPTAAIVESHLAHLLPVDHVIVLRCDPDELERRLRTRLGGNADDQQAKVGENVESERLDLIYVEALDRHGDNSVTAIDTTEQTPTETAQAIDRAVQAAESHGPTATGGAEE